MKLDEYLYNTLGINVKITPLNKPLYSNIPMYITTAYDIKETTVFEQQLCLLHLKEESNGIFTPDALEKQMKLVEQKTALPVVFIFDNVVSYNLTRYVKKGINFIIPGKQMFVPALMINLRKAQERIPQKVKHLYPVAQLMLLYHLQKEKLTGLTTKELTEIFGQSYRTINRAVNNLVDSVLCKLTGEKEKRLEFIYSRKELWDKSRDYLQNPVEKQLFTDEYSLDSNIAFISGINALAAYTMINDESQRYYALYKKEVSDLHVKTNKYGGENVIELWKYDPMPLSKDGIIDKLSLFLLFKDDENERIQIELETMIEDMQW